MLVTSVCVYIFMNKKLLFQWMIDIMFVSISKKQKKEEEDIMFVPYPKNVKRCHRKTYINYILNLIINSFNLNPNCFSDP